MPRMRMLTVLADRIVTDIRVSPLHQSKSMTVVLKDGPCVKNLLAGLVFERLVDLIPLPPLAYRTLEVLQTELRCHLYTDLRVVTPDSHDEEVGFTTVGVGCGYHYVWTYLEYSS